MEVKNAVEIDSSLSDDFNILIESGKLHARCFLYNGVP